MLQNVWILTVNPDFRPGDPSVLQRRTARINHTHLQSSDPLEHNVPKIQLDPKLKFGPKGAVQKVLVVVTSTHTCRISARFQGLAQDHHPAAVRIGKRPIPADSHLHPQHRVSSLSHKPHSARDRSGDSRIRRLVLGVGHGFCHGTVNHQGPGSHGIWNLH